jgi:hypothetical protein
MKMFKDRLVPIDENKYVLTLDFASKMLNIHERRKCGIPVVIEGETGVGKTALIEMLSILWNYEYIQKLKKAKEDILSILKKGICVKLSYLFNGLLYLAGFTHQGISCTEEANSLIRSLDALKVVKRDDLTKFLSLHHNWFKFLKTELSKIFGTDIVHLVTCEIGDGKAMLLNEVLESMKQCDAPIEVRNQVVIHSRVVVLLMSLLKYNGHWLFFNLTLWFCSISINFPSILLSFCLEFHFITSLCL